MSLFLIILTHLAFGPYSQSLEGSFESNLKFYSKGENFSGMEQMEITEVAWKGERISKQIVIWSEYQLIENIDYNISDFSDGRNVIPSENVYLRFIEYVRTDPESRACSGYLNRDPELYDELGDVLSDNQVTSVDPGTPVRLWMTINIPISADTGLYNGTLSVTVAGSSELEFKMDLQVVDYSLPEISDWEFHLDLWQFPTVVIDRYNDHFPLNKIDYWSDEHFRLLKPKYILLANMGQKVITAHIKEGALGAASMIEWIKKADDSWEYNFSVFDRYVDSLMSWGIDKQISCQSPVGWNKDEIPYWDKSLNTVRKLNAPPGSETYETRWDHFLTQFKMHLDTKEWFSKAVLFLDEVESSEMIEVIQMINDNHPDWKIGMAGFHTPTEFIDTNVFDMSLMVGIPDNGDRLDGLSTFYLSCNPPHPNSFVVSDARPAENIWIAWHAIHMDYHGFLRWAYDYWLESDPYEMRTGGHTSGDFSLCYRSSNSLDMKVYSSVRLELIREGIQDFEKILILRSRFENYDIAEDRYKLNLLNSKINEFTFTSGQSISVTELVKGAQELLKDIVTQNTHTNNYTATFRDFGFKIYPNPLRNEYLNISLTNYHGQANISVFDMYGKIIYGDNLSLTGSINHPVQLEGCGAGVYIVAISSERHEINAQQKFIITR